MNILTFLNLISPIGNTGGEQESISAEENRRRRKHGMLKMFYGLDDETGGAQGSLNPVDINGAHFNPEVYLAKLMKEKRLTDLIDRESDMVKRMYYLIQFL